MALNSIPGGGSSHVSLHEAAALARGLVSFSGAQRAPTSQPPPLALRASRSPSPPQRTPSTAAASAPSFEPYTPVVSHAGGDGNRWDTMLNQLALKHQVPPMFLKAVMLAESGGRPDAVGDSGHSVGLFQLHDQGYGSGMGDARYDPRINAERAVQGLSEAWHAGERAGYSGERAVRAAYDYSFNPGGGWGYQGDGLVRIYNALRAEAGQPPLS